MTAITIDDLTAAPRLTRATIARKLFHINGGTPAWFIRFMRPTTVIGVTLFLLLLNRYIMPRFANGRRFWAWERLWRETERRKKSPSGILAYCAAILIISIIFHEARWMTAAIWGMLAYGDGMAELVGRAAGGPRLPWNRNKGWAGTGAFILFGGAAAAALMAWTLRAPFADALPLAVALAVVCGITESLPFPLDDNLTIPTAGAITLPLLAAIPALAIV